jgi:putative ABC transport system permease protein
VRRERRRHVVPEVSRFAARDLLGEAIAGLLQRPTRSVLTTLGVVLGVGSFVAILGLTSTARGQIGGRFDALRNTAVTVVDTGGESAPGDGAPPSVDFPEDADLRATGLNGATAAGVCWAVPLRNPLITRTPTLSGAHASGGTVYAASPGLFRAVRATVATGVAFNRFHDDRSERVAVLGAALASRLGVSQLAAAPAVFINGRSFTVVGIISDTARMPELLFAVIIPRRTAETYYPLPDPRTSPARMIIETAVGAGPQVARQVPVALRPDRPDAFTATAPPDPRSLFDAVDTDLSALFLILATVSLGIGAVGITNTTLVAILERVPEIGLRRSLGARPIHIALQTLTETTVLGLLGGLVGTSLGVAAVLLTAVVKHWSAVMDPLTVLPSPLLGAVVGIVSGLYPSVRAARIEPLEALRR